MRVKSSLYRLVVSVCQLLNVAYLTVDYMSYKTETNAAYTYPITLEMPKLSLCFDLFAFLSREEKQKGRHRHQFYFNETLAQMLSVMPPASQVIKSCAYRNFTLNLLQRVTDAHECGKVFEVVRYKMQGFVCYRFQVKNVSRYSYHSLVNSLYESRQLFHLVIDDPLASESVFFPLLHLTEYPDGERAFQREVFRSERSLNYLSYGLQETKSLPSPYASRCVQLSPLACFQSCIDSSYRERGFMTDSAIIREDENNSLLHLVPPNHSMERAMNSSRLECHKKCKFDACALSLVDTRISPPYSTNEKLEFVVETLNRFPLKIEHDEKFSLVDYLTQIASVIGIWTAVSFVSLNRFFNLKLRRRDSQLLKGRVDSQYNLLKKIFLEEFPPSQRKWWRRRQRRLNQRCGKINSIVPDTIIRLLVLICFTWQLVNVLTNFFAFKTTVRLEYELNAAADVPSLAICLTYEEFFNLRVPPYVTERDYDQYFRSVHSTVNHTVEQLLVMAGDRPVVQSCSWRNMSDRFKPLVEFTGEECLDMFTIHPFLASRHVCYSIQPVITSLANLKQSDVRFMVADPGVMYSLSLAEDLGLRKARLYIYFGRKLPNWVTEFVQLSNDDQKGREVFLSYRSYSINLLPAPYDTRCSTRMSKCYFECLSEAIREFNRVPYSKIESEMVSKRLLSYVDLTNDTIYDAWKAGEELCESRCSHFSCHFDFTSARLTASRKSVERTFKVSPETPVFAASIVNTVPAMHWYELMYQVFCSMSFWLGFSFIRVNPFRLAISRVRNTTRKSIRLKVQAIEKAIDRLKPCRPQAWTERKYHSTSRRLPRARAVYLVAAVACLLHISYSLTTYLGYPSYIDVEQHLEDITSYTLFLCLDLSELLARNEKLDVKLLSVAEKSRLLNHTIDHFFANTPREHEIMDACSHWGLIERSDKLQKMEKLTDRIMFFTTNKSKCHQIYRVRKIAFSNSMCYSFIPKNFTEWSRVRWKNTLNGEKTFFKIFTNSTVLTSRFSLVPCFAQYLPVSSSAWAQNMVKDKRYNNYRVSYVRYLQTTLPSPYPHPSFSPFLFDRCLGNCVNSRLKRSNLTFSSRFFGSRVSSTIRYYNYFDRQRYENQEILTTLIDTCERSCAHYNDHIIPESHTMFQIIVPVVAVSRDAEYPSDKVLFEMVFTTVPTFFISYKLRLSLLEEIINLGSIMSIWFGFSFISLARFSKTTSPSRRKINAIEREILWFSAVFRPPFHRANHSYSRRL